MWSPKTGIFTPSLILKSLYQSLKEKGVKFLKKSVKLDDSENNELDLQDNTRLRYFKYINAAGAGSLNIAKSVTYKFNNLTILPFLGQYVTQNVKIEIKTNLYPVPDPELPF